MRTVIGLAGVKTSGKSTVANMIKELVPSANESTLADKLKNVSTKVFGLERNQFDAQELKEVPFEKPIILTANHITHILQNFGVYFDVKDFHEKYEKLIGMELETPRKIAQVIGTEILRATGDEDIHCDNVKIHDGVTIISDLRFPNEFAYFSRNKDIKFIPIYIQRNEAEQHVTEESHPSEKCVFEFSDKCLKVDNNGSLNDTERQVREILEKELFGN